MKEGNSGSGSDGSEKDAAAAAASTSSSTSSSKTTFTCALFGWARGDPCPEVTIETSGGTTSYLDPKALSSSLGACAAAAAGASSSSSISSSVSPSFPSSPLTLPGGANKNSNNREKADALGAIADAVRSSLPPAPPDPIAAASAASAAAASLASAAAAGGGGDDAAARAQAWAAVVDAKPGAAVAVVGARPPISPRNLRSSAAAKNLSLSFEYLGTVTDVASAAVCSGLCQQFVAGADNAGGEIMGVTEFGTHTVSGRAG